MHGSSVNAAVVDQLRAIVGPQQVSARESTRQGLDLWPVAMKDAAVPLLGEQPVVRVSPTTAKQVVEVLRLCRATNTSVTPFGGGSGVAGAAIPLAGGVLLDLVGLRQVRQIDAENLLVTAEAGLIGGRLEQRVREEGFTLGFYPQSLDLATLGGWVAAGAVGTYSGRYGGIEDRLAGVEVALADGMLTQTPVMPRPAIGPNLAQLFVGSEGTLGVITAVTLRMVPWPERRLLRALRFPALPEGLRALQAIARKGLRPAVVRFHDETESWRLRDLDPRFEPGCLLLLAFDGPAELTEMEEDLTMRLCLAHGAVDLGPEPAERWDADRLKPPASFAWLRAEGVTGDYVDIQAPWSRLLESYQAVRNALMPHCTSVGGYVTHVTPQGCAIYFVIGIKAADDAEAVSRYRQSWAAAMAAAEASGAAIAHNRGIGLVRAPWFVPALGDAWPLWERVKAAFDPQRTLNPGKLADPRDDADLHAEVLVPPPATV